MPLRREEMIAWAERIIGKMSFNLRTYDDPITINNIAFDQYNGRINSTEIEKEGRRNIITIHTDNHVQNFDSDMKLSSDGKLLIDTANGYSCWAIVMEDKEILELKRCDLCLSRCKRNGGSCDLFDSILQIYTKGVVMK